MGVDLSGAVGTALKKAVAEARRLALEREPVRAAAAYRKAARLAEQYAGTLPASLRATYAAKSEEYERLADRLEAEAREPKEPAAPAAAMRDAADRGGVHGDDEVEESALACIDRSPVTWDDIGGLEDTRKEIVRAYRIATGLPPPGVTLSTLKGMLLYGPPGTGKTLLAAATSNSLGATFFNVALDRILHELFGRSVRVLSRVFALARERAPSVVFIDECDALASSRDSMDSGVRREMLNVLLTEAEGFRGKGKRAFVLTVGATNAPWTLDEAMVQRFERRIYIPLPDPAARRQILELNLLRKGHTLEVALDGIVKRTEGMSGRELAYVCREAVDHMLGEANPGLDSPSHADAGPVALRVRPLQAADFDAAFKRIQASTSKADLERYVAWRDGLA